MQLQEFIEVVGDAQGIVLHSCPPNRPGSTLYGLDVYAATGVAVLADGSEIEIQTTGKGANRETRIWSAAMEALERKLVLEARADARGSASCLDGDVVAPDRMILPPGCTDPDHTCLDWSLASSCRDGRQVLIPRPVRGGLPGLFSHTTNGAAGGQGRADALERGLLEVIERDAFLTTWFARRSASLLQRPYTGTNEGIALWLEGGGFHVAAYRLQADTGVPVMLALAIQAAGGPISRGGVIAGISAGLGVTQALEGALLEIVQVNEAVLTTPNLDWDAWPEGLRGFASTDRTGDFAFLDGGSSASVEVVAHDGLAPIIDQLLAQGFETYAIDRTQPWLDSLHLAVLEVNVPGLQPLLLSTEPELQRIAWSRFKPEERLNLKVDLHPLG
jgi:ribosomal protein S12 methylthiotransferase accessory factor